MGALALVTVLAGVLILRFLDKTAASSEGYLVYFLMDDVTGIVKRSHVRIAGIPVGYIEDIRLEGGRGRVDMRIKGEVELYEDARAVKRTKNLLGEYFVALSQGTSGKSRLGEGDRIAEVAPAAGTDQVLQSVARIAATAEKITNSLALTIGSEESQFNMRATLQNLADVTAALNLTVAENRQSIRSILSAVEAVTSHGKADAVEILDNIRAITADLRSFVGGTIGTDNVKEKGDGSSAQEKVATLIERMGSATKNLEGTLANLESTTARLERGEGTLGRLLTDEALIEEIEHVTTEVSDYVSGISQLRTVLSLRSDYQFRTQTVKSFMELRLQPREDKYYAIEIVNDPRGLTRIEQTSVSTTNPTQPNQYQEIRSVTSNALRFSLQFAQRFGPVVGRFGLKESTGGVGLDLLLLNDALEIRQDLFGFGEVARPRWRGSVGYSFLNRLWLLGGVDDIISRDRREYFVGMQLRFDDEDLKTVMPFVSFSP